MYKNLKKYKGIQFLAFTGFPLFLYILFFIDCFIKNDHIFFEYITVLIVIPYLLVTLLVSIVIFIAELIYKKTKCTHVAGFEQDLLSDMLFSFGLTIYLFVISSVLLLSVLFVE